MLDQQDAIEKLQRTKGISRVEAIYKLRDDAFNAMQADPAIFANLMIAAFAYMRFYAKHHAGVGDATAHIHDMCCGMLGHIRFSADCFGVPVPDIPKDVQALIKEWEGA